jgi:hypothetical protein
MDESGARHLYCALQGRKDLCGRRISTRGIESQTCTPTLAFSDSFRCSTHLLRVKMIFLQHWRSIHKGHSGSLVRMCGCKQGVGVSTMQ